jgi:uncharacterized protein
VNLRPTPGSEIFTERRAAIGDDARMSRVVARQATVDEFLAGAGDFLVTHEAENNLLLGITSSLRANPELFGDETPRFATVTNARGAVVAASLRTPPWNQVVSWTDDPEAADALADAFADDSLPGVIGPSAVAARFAERWHARTGRPVSGRVAERIFQTDRVVPPERPARGTWRHVAARDRDLIARWLEAFAAEATPWAPPLDDALEMADRWIAGIGRTGYAWDDAGEVVCFVGAGGETPNGARIGPVYTPPERRGHGYATSLTAAATHELLDGGRRFVFLFTDLANPTSNKIYQAIGYRPVCDVDVYRFGPDA